MKEEDNPEFLNLIQKHNRSSAGNARLNKNAIEKLKQKQKTKANKKPKKPQLENPEGLFYK